MKSTWIIFIFLSFVPLKSFAEFDYTDLVGEWASYKLNEEFGSSYYYLRIDSDYSGEFGFMSRGFEGKGFSFTSEGENKGTGTSRSPLPLLDPTR